MSPSVGPCACPLVRGGGQLTDQYGPSIHREYQISTKSVSKVNALGSAGCMRKVQIYVSTYHNGTYNLILLIYALEIFI